MHIITKRGREEGYVGFSYFLLKLDFLTALQLVRGLHTCRRTDRQWHTDRLTYKHTDRKTVSQTQKDWQTVNKCVQKDRQTYRKTGRQTDRQFIQTERLADRQPERQADRQKGHKEKMVHCLTLSNRLFVFVYICIYNLVIKTKAQLSQ